MYLTSNWSNQTSNVDVHWIFTNSALSNTGFRLNLQNNAQGYNCGDNAAAIHMWPEGHGGKQWQNYPYISNPASCNPSTNWCGCSIDFRDYIGAWHVFEYKMQISGTDVILTEWIDGTQTRGPITGPGQDTSSFNTLIVSGWNNNAGAWVGDFYIDDIVVADSYIGPISGASPYRYRGFGAGGASLK